MEDYSSLVEGLRRKSKFFDQMVGQNETSILFENSVLAIEALVAERDAALKALGESRAAFGDSEARRAELEAVIEKVHESRRENAGDGEWFYSTFHVDHALYAVPSVVLADRDREIAARALEDTADYFQPYFTVYADKLRIRAASIRKGGNA